MELESRLKYLISIHPYLLFFMVFSEIGILLDIKSLYHLPNVTQRMNQKNVTAHRVEQLFSPPSYLTVSKRGLPFSCIQPSPRQDTAPFCSDMLYSNLSGTYSSQNTPQNIHIKNKMGRTTQTPSGETSPQPKSYPDKGYSLSP